MLPGKLLKILVDLGDLGVGLAVGLAGLVHVDHGRVHDRGTVVCAAGAEHSLRRDDRSRRDDRIVDRLVRLQSRNQDVSEQIQ